MENNNQKKVVGDEEGILSITVDCVWFCVVKRYTPAKSDDSRAVESSEVFVWRYTCI